MHTCERCVPEVTCDETHSAAPEGLPQMYPWCVMRRSLPDFTIGGGIRELTAGTAAAQLLTPISVQHGRSAIPGNSTFIAAGISRFEVVRAAAPRGRVLRCTIDDGGGDDDSLPVISVDDQEFSWDEFGRMLHTFAGWGMRLIFVPDDELERSPRIEVREPNE